MYSCWFCGEDYEPENSTAVCPEEFCSLNCEEAYKKDEEIE